MVFVWDDEVDKYVDFDKGLVVRENLAVGCWDVYVDSDYVASDLYLDRAKRLAEDHYVKMTKKGV